MTSWTYLLHAQVFLFDRRRDEDLVDVPPDDVADDEADEENGDD